MLILSKSKWEEEESYELAQSKAQPPILEAPKPPPKKTAKLRKRKK